MSKGRTVHARRDPIRISDLSFMHGDAKLKGRLWSPTTTGRHPAVLLIGGTGKNLRDDFRIYPYLLVKEGYVVLAFDKEGFGESGGDRTMDEEGIDALAQQNEAGVQALRQLGNVDPQRVGVLGISHGAWVAVRLARKDRLAFVIAIVGGGVPVWKATLHEVHQRLIKTQDPAAVQAGDAFMVKVFDALRSGDADALPKLINGSKDETWFNQTPVAPFIGAPDEFIVSIGKQRWANELSYDPKEDLRDMHIPLLAIEGERDESTPPEQNLAALSATSQPAATVVMLPGANHHQAIDDDESLRYSPRLEPAFTTWVHNLAKSREFSRKQKRAIIGAVVQAGVPKTSASY